MVAHRVRLTVVRKYLMSNVTKFPKDPTNLAQLRVLLLKEKTKTRKLKAATRMLKAQVRALNLSCAERDREIIILKEKMESLSQLSRRTSPRRPYNWRAGG